MPPIELGLDSFGDVTEAPGGGLKSHAAVIRDVVEEVVAADAAGVDFIGLGEHHRDDFAIVSPEMVLAVAAGRTRRIRLGSAVTVLGSDDPIRVYQRFATLHAASGGRAEIIVGRGSFIESFPLFGLDLARYEPLFEEKLDLLVALLRQERITWEGDYRPPLLDQPVYPTLPPDSLRVWVGVGGTPQSVVRAAHYRLALMLAVIGGDPGRFRPFVDLYHRALAQFGAPALPVGAHSPGHVAATDAEARDGFYAPYKAMRDRIGAERGWPPMERAEYDHEIEHGSLYVGSPATVAEKIARTVRTLGLSRFDLKYSAGRLSHEAMMRCIALYGTDVAPRVRAILA